MAKISVIVPVFNSEIYLGRCIDSILCQTYTDIEIVLVDDGSTDNSSKICDDYSFHNSKIRVIHKTNEGVTAARRDGVLESTGDWITFVDSDDTLPPNALTYLLNVAAKCKYDIVVGAWRKIYPSHKRLIPLCSNGHYDSEQYIRLLLLEKCYRGPVGKLFRKDLFDDDTFNISREIILNEDLIMNIKLALKANTCYVLSKRIVYNYYFIENSASNSGMKKNNWDILFSSVLSLSNTKQYKDACIHYIITIMHRIREVINIEKLSFFEIVCSLRSECGLIDRLLIEDLVNSNKVTKSLIRIYNSRYSLYKLAQICLEKMCIIYK